MVVNPQNSNYRTKVRNNFDEKITPEWTHFFFRKKNAYFMFFFSSFKEITQFFCYSVFSENNQILPIKKKKAAPTLL